MLQKLLPNMSANMDIASHPGFQLLRQRLFKQGEPFPIHSHVTPACNSAASMCTDFLASQLEPDRSPNCHDMEKEGHAVLRYSYLGFDDDDFRTAGRGCP